MCRLSDLKYCGRHRENLFTLNTKSNGKIHAYFSWRQRHSPEMKSPEAMQKHMEKWFAWVEKLRKEGRYEGGEPLEPRGKFVNGPKRIVTDGPFAESKELVGGYFIILTKDLEEAVGSRTNHH